MASCYGSWATRTILIVRAFSVCVGRPPGDHRQPTPLAASTHARPAYGRCVARGEEEVLERIVTRMQAAGREAVGIWSAWGLRQ